MSTNPPPGSGQAPGSGPGFRTGAGPGPGPGAGPGGLGGRIEEAVELIEMELRHAIAYVNDAVIPQVRKESILAMRSLSDTIRNLADRIERRQHNDQAPPQGPQS